MTAMAERNEDIADDIRRRLDRPIALIGLMGCGKTRIGRHLADALDLPFMDSDDEVEKAAGMTVADIFDRFGEEYFRQGERRVISRLLDGGIRVIATGGGALMTPETAQEIWTRTVSVWMRADIPVMVERTARTERRPLLRNGDPAQILEALAEKRYPVYAKADITVDSHNGPVESILNQTLDALRRFLYK